MMLGFMVGVDVDRPWVGLGAWCGVFVVPAPHAGTEVVWGLCSVSHGGGLYRHGLGQADSVNPALSERTARSII